MEQENTEEIKESIDKTNKMLKFINDNITSINYKLEGIKMLAKTGSYLRKASIILSVVSVFLIIFALFQLYVFLVLIGVIQP